MSGDTKKSSLTPLMRQFHAIKEKHPDKILFFRMGDFYEMFGSDAERAAPILGITLTSRGQGADGERIPLAGVPYHAGDKYLARLLAAGEKVVVVEQVEDPKTAKGIVKRDIVEILTPGTATVEGVSDGDHSMILAAVYQDGRKRFGMAALDLTTGLFQVEEGLPNRVTERLRVLEPAEILVPDDDNTKSWRDKLGLTGDRPQLTTFGEWNFDAKTAERDLNDHFGTSTLDGFGVGEHRLAVAAAGAVYRYLRENHRDHLSHITRLTRFDDTETMLLDYSTVRNLELTRSIASGTEEHSLFSVINFTQTGAGARRLRQNLLRPFRNRVTIERRLTGVAELVRNRDLAADLRVLMRGLPDMEKLTGRLGIGKLSPRQAAGIAQVLSRAREIATLLTRAGSPHLVQLRGTLPDCTEIISRVQEALVDEPPLVASKGGIIRDGYSTELDELNDSIHDARVFIASLQKMERHRTGITSLKVGYNKVFGYYLEVTKANTEQVPDNYIRKQTLVNAERYITEDLKVREDLIQTAEEKIFRLEERLFAELVSFLDESIANLLSTAQIMAEIDLVSGLSELAVQHGYCRPELFEDGRLEIVGGRHPVIEAVLPSGSFVANDVGLVASDYRMVILTGPNMSGKSTYLRQIGLIVILAQIGSFVPAERADIGLVDRVFTRVGALDNLAQGQSTFLVEMVETANILHNATAKSLVLLDEVGRGTSTFDGLSVAWAVVEYINERNLSRTIFATHYHELTSMAGIYSHIRNFQVAVKKWEDTVVFLHQIIPGGCDDSYGIEVGKLAGLPRSTIGRAKQILRLLESGKFNQSELGKGIYQERLQPTLFDPQPSVVEERLRQLKIDNMTPLEALALLKELQEELE